jgi:alkyl hydroperoxide reductase subunit AhpC
MLLIIFGLILILIVGTLIICYNLDKFTAETVVQSENNINYEFGVENVFIYASSESDFTWNGPNDFGKALLFLKDHKPCFAKIGCEPLILDCPTVSWCGSIKTWSVFELKAKNLEQPLFFSSVFRNFGKKYSVSVFLKFGGSKAFV